MRDTKNDVKSPRETNLMFEVLYIFTFFSLYF